MPSNSLFESQSPKTVSSTSAVPRSRKSDVSLNTKSPKRNGSAKSDSTKEARLNQHPPTKPTRNRIPPPQRERILHEYVAGSSISDISKKEKRNRETITKIVRGPEMQEFVRAMRERFFGLGDDAISAVRHSLTEQNDGRLGFQLLASIGVIPSPEERPRLAIALAPTLDEGAAITQVIAGMIEMAVATHSAYGLPMPELDPFLEKAGGRINFETGKIEPLEKKNCDVRNDKHAP